MSNNENSRKRANNTRSYEEEEEDRRRAQGHSRYTTPSYHDASSSSSFFRPRTPSTPQHTQYGSSQGPSGSTTSSSSASSQLSAFVDQGKTESTGSQFQSGPQMVVQQQTEPSVRPKVRTQRVAEKPTHDRRQQTYTQNQTSTRGDRYPAQSTSYDRYPFHNTSGFTRSSSQPSAGSRRYSMGDMPTDDLSQRMSDLSFGGSDFQYSLRRPLPNLWSHDTRQQATQPSVRTKVRTPLRPTGSPPPPIASGIPEPDIVGRYRNAITGDPDPQRLREPIKLMNRTDNTALDLTNLSRRQIREMVNEANKKNKRKEDYLEDRGFEPVQFKPPGGRPYIRYQPSVESRREFELPTQRRTLIPSRQTDLLNQTDPRFNRPKALMGKKSPPDPLSPLGRQGYGPLPRRAMSMPDLSSPGFGNEPPRTNLQLFRERYSQLKPKHQDYYKNFRDQIDWRENPYAQGRMVKAPTRMAIGDVEKERLSEMSTQRMELLKNVRASQQDRRGRRRSLYQRAVLHPSIKDARKDWLFAHYSKTIPEEDEEEDDEEEE